MSKLVRMARDFFNFLGAVGVVIAGVKSAPLLWDADPLSCIIVCASVAFVAITMVERAVVGAK